MLAGKKTYISALILALATCGRTLDWLSQEQYELVLGLASSLGLAALRAGIASKQ